MALTPNYSWPTPDNTDLVKDGAEAIRDLGNAIDNTVNSLPSGGLVHIESVTMSGVASQAIENVFTSDYDSYKIIVTLTGVAASSGDLRLKLRNNTTDNSSTYYRSATRVTTATVSGEQDNDVTTGWLVLETRSTRNTTSYNCVIELRNPLQNSFTTGLVASRFFSAAENRCFMTGGLTHEVTGSFNGVNFIVSAGNVTGSISVYGYAKA